MNLNLGRDGNRFAKRVDLVVDELLVRDRIGDCGRHFRVNEMDWAHDEPISLDALVVDVLVDRVCRCDHARDDGPDHRARIARFGDVHFDDHGLHDHDQNHRAAVPRGTRDLLAGRRAVGLVPRPRWKVARPSLARRR